jgi:ribonuclease HI
MLITLFTDVSHDHQSRIGAYAWWAKVDDVTFRGAAVFDDAIESSNVAKIYGVINGVYAAIHTIKPPSGTKIVAQSDSGIAIAVLQGRAARRYIRLHQMMTAMLTKHCLEIEYRQAANAWCDQTARALMRDHRKQAGFNSGFLTGLGGIQ